MPWVRIAAEFCDNPKVLQVGPLGMSLYVAGLCYCNRNLTDGFIPWAKARSLMSFEFLAPPDKDGSQDVVRISVSVGRLGHDVSSSDVADMLVAAGLWEEVDGGYSVHDYREYQPTRAEVVGDREGAKRRMTAVRANKERTQSEHVPNMTRTSAEQCANIAEQNRSSGEVRAKFGRSSGTPGSGSDSQIDDDDDDARESPISGDPEQGIRHADDPVAAGSDEAWANEQALVLCVQAGFSRSVVEAAIADVRRRVASGELRKPSNLPRYVLRVLQNQKAANDAALARPPTPGGNGRGYVAPEDLVTQRAVERRRQRAESGEPL
jgi:hypothetical protein